MVVDLNNRDLVVAYVREQASRGLAHVTALVRADRDDLVAMIADLSADEASFSPAAGEFSTTQVLQHLNASFERSIDRLATLSSGRPWLLTGAAPVAGSLPDGLHAAWDEVRRYFIEGEDRVLAVLNSADSAKGLELTADHAAYGPFNWLQWAAYSHHAHANDHVEQVRRLREEILRRRQPGRA